MASTEAGHADPQPSMPRNSLPKPSSDLETFCTASLKLLQSSEKNEVQLHDNLLQFEECGKQCGFCRYLYASFGNEVVELTARYKLGGGPYVVAQIDDLSAADKHKSVQKARLWVSMLEDDKVQRFRKNSFGGRSYILLSNGARGLERAVWSSAIPVDFDARIPTLSHWLSECINEHPKCLNTTSSSAPLAARILEVLTESADPVLRLVSTNSLGRHNTQYAVLTHCWGGVEINSKTTSANVDEYFTSIDIETLPKTFREAIQIARALQLRHLWIDSLCIIQQSSLDWERESAKMASIFRNATLTISASTAKNSTQGCGITNTLVPSTQFTLPSKTGLGQPQPYLSISPTHGNHPEAELLDWYREYPIHNRAWIFQEKVLSRRILHATHGQFIYQCATHMESEDGNVYSYSNNMGSYAGAELLDSHIPEHVIRPTVSNNRGYHDIRNRWWSWMHDYNKRQLTNPGDNYAALAGVTALYRELTGDEPVLAMWRSDLVLHLAWEAELLDKAKVELLRNIKLERRPSWTWMSYPHGTVEADIYGVDFDDTDRAVTPQLLTSIRCYKAEITGLDIQWSGPPLVSSPSHAVVKLRGLKHRLSVRTNKAKGVSGRLRLDPGISELKDNDMYDVFALYANKNEPTLINLPWRLHTCYLVLEAVDRDSKVYRRIGRFMLHDPIESGKVAEDHLYGTYEEIVLV